MSKATDTLGMAGLNLEDDTEDLFASPSTSGANTQKHTPTSNASSAHKQSQPRTRSQSETRDARLHAELERVREVNRVIEGVTSSLEKARANMGTVQRTVENASTLLATWTRILSQTEHNQRLILNPQWQGATQDVEDIESEELRRQQESERKDYRESKKYAWRAGGERDESSCWCWWSKHPGKRHEQYGREGHGDREGHDKLD
ncbi:hypothetical protein KC367_g6559 [Hortaea werneckii]|nr:hypothetical protein KC358_g16598 [Hortaea werneckii]KAI6798363.1 hypothetical protein KC350_g16361 [Hortaea werneckii]KAI6838271.1 hypothetical protein KC342_g4146 [Hortaea werneckii]KAI6901045.1 hypothetical protein KC348_g16595 [Hortaea werneckii]KAI6920619.1 hypothetical protein KC341_g16496 [Hortaea werneckii]